MDVLRLLGRPFVGFVRLGFLWLFRLGLGGLLGGVDVACGGQFGEALGGQLDLVAGAVDLVRLAVSVRVCHGCDHLLSFYAVAAMVPFTTMSMYSAKKVMPVYATVSYARLFSSLEWLMAM